jgi:osmotically-inducible protein OsmY
MVAMIKSDAALQQDVLDELDWDPEVEVTEVGVEVDDGVVTLTGTVTNYTTKLAAERAAFRVAGVRAVANDVQVHYAWDEARTDTDIAQAAANVIEHNTTIPTGTIHIRVANGLVTLSGEVQRGYQRQLAEKAVKRIRGVVGVHNVITIAQQPASAEEIKQSVERALVRSAELDAECVSVYAFGGHVTLSGSVRSWAERQEAEDTAWKAPGITSVTNNISIRVR